MEKSDSSDFVFCMYYIYATKLKIDVYIVSCTYAHICYLKALVIKWKTFVFQLEPLLTL